MPILSKDKLKIISITEMHDEYKRIATWSNTFYKKGDIIIKKEKINFSCDCCGKIETKMYYVILEKYSLYENKVLCHSCSVKKTKKIKYGDENYNNIEKQKETFQNKSTEEKQKIVETRIATNIKKYGTRGAPYKRTGKRKEVSKSTGLKISIKAKERLSNKENHPMYGKHHSQESIEKNRNSNIKTTTERILSGNFFTSSIFENGSFYSYKMNCNIIYRSSYEKMFYFLLENCSSISSYYVEKIVIPYYDEATCKNRNYFPDVLVKWKDNTIDLVEIKPENLKENITNICKFNAAKEYIKSESIDNFYIFSKLEGFKYIFKKINSLKELSPLYLKNLYEYISELNINNYI